MSIKSHIIIFTILCALTIFIYYPSLSGGFHHDDRPNLVFNEKVQIDTLSFESIKQAATSSSAGKLKRPISMGSFGLNYYFFGEDAFSFKLTNTFLHIFVAVIVFFVIYLLQLEINKNKRSAFFFASIATLIWVAHPLHVSTVAYVVQRMTILAALFSLLAILFYILGRKKIIVNSGSGTPYFFLCLLSIILGLYSKENAALTPFFILLIEAIIFYPQSKSENYKKYSKPSFLFISAFIIVCFLFFRNDIYHFLSNWYYTSREFTISERLYTQARIVLYYIKWLLLPNVQELGLFHDDIPLSESLFSPITTFISILAIAATMLWAFFIRKSQPIATLGIGWFFIGHLLESTIIPLEMIYEHRNYLPSIGLIIAILSLLTSIFTKLPKLHRYSSIIASIVIIIFSMITFTRSTQWSDPINFAYFEAIHHPNSLRATHTLGVEYMGMVKSGYFEYKNDAYKYLEKGSQLGDKRLFSEIALLRLAKHLNEPAKPVWIDRMANKLSTPMLRIDDMLILKEITLCKDQQCLLPKDAASILIEATESNPRLTLKDSIASSFYATKAAFILQRGGKIQRAEEYLKQAIELEPQNIQNYVDYITLLISLEKTSEAITYLDKAKQHNKVKQNIILLDALGKTIEKNAKANDQYDMGQTG